MILFHHTIYIADHFVSGDVNLLGQLVEASKILKTLPDDRESFRHDLTQLLSILNVLLNFGRFDCGLFWERNCYIFAILLATVKFRKILLILGIYIL